MTEAARKPIERIDDASLDRKLVCLSAWLERTTEKEGQAAQARAVLPASALTVGTVLAAAFLSIDERWFGFGIFICLALSAVGLFLVQQRRYGVWLRVARRLEDEQKALLKTDTADKDAKIGCYTPEQLADIFGPKEPISFMSGPAIGFYAAMMAFAILLVVFALTKDDELLHSRALPAYETAPSGSSRAVF